MSTDTATKTPLAPNWRHVNIFLALTFGLSWLLDLALYLRGGLSIPGIATFEQLQTLLPAFSAILLGLFFFPESPLYRGRPAECGRWFYYYFLLMTVIYAASTMGVLLTPSQGTLALISTITQLLTLLGLVVLVVLRIAAGREAAARVWLSWGKIRYWLLFGLGIAAFYILQVALNALFGLGGNRLTVPTSLARALGSLNPAAFLIVGAASAVLLGPVLSIVVYFGEEYGWRGYLQTELTKMGRVRGVLLVGVIWGAWHWPAILMGFNYPGHPLVGLLLMVLYSTGNAVILGYAVLHSGSILLAAYLHALIDQVINLLVTLGFRPYDPAFSFGIGIYGIAMLAIIAFLIFRDPIWRDRGSNLPLFDLSIYV